MPVKPKKQKPTPEKSTSTTADRDEFRWPYGKRNYLIFGVALLVIILGYIALGQPPVDGFLSLTLAPILLVIGYCILIPLSLILRDKVNTTAADESEPTAET